MQAQLKGKILPASTLTSYQLWAKKEGFSAGAEEHIIDIGELIVTDVFDEAAGHRVLRVSSFMHSSEPMSWFSLT